MSSRYRNNLIIVSILISALSAGAVELRSYRITCDPEEFEMILANPYEDIYIDCVFEYENDEWDDARFRLRGNTSREYPKKSYKVNFDRDNRFMERDKINLISEWTDASYSREYLTYDFYLQTGLTAPSSWFARLYINDVYQGLYLDVEQIDEHFLASQGLQSNTAIYKADVSGALLTTTEIIEEKWEKETLEETGFYDLENLIETIDITPDEQFFDFLVTKFYRDELANALAINALTANQSTYYHNYYLFDEISEDGKWRYVPWDVDKTFYYWNNYNNPRYFRCGHQSLIDLNPLINRCWRNTEMRDNIVEKMQTISESLIFTGYLDSMCVLLEQLLYDAIAEDTLKQFTTEEFVISINSIPDLASNRTIDVFDRIEHDPLPFNINQALITPEGVYFSWDSTYTLDSSQIVYKILIGDHYLFSGENITIENISNNSYLCQSLEPGTYFWKVYAESLTGGITQSMNFFSKIEVLQGAFSGTTIIGSIDSSATWTLEESPYSLPQGLLINPDAVLTIEPGVLVGIGPGQTIRCRGGINAYGTIDDSIHFVPINPDSNWGAIVIDWPTHESNFEYVTITGGSDDNLGYNFYGVLQVRGAVMNMSHCYLHHCAYGAILTNYAEIYLNSVTFEYCYKDVVYVHHGKAIIDSCYFAHGSLETSLFDYIDFEGVSDTSSITRCEFYICGDDIIDLDNVQNIEISQNIISGAGDKGFSIGDNSANVYITNNIITNCDYGIITKWSASTALYNNTFYNNNVGIAVELEESESIVRNNVIWQSETPVLLLQGAEIDIAYSLLDGDTLYPGDGNIIGDPLFIDPQNGNFLLQPDSPLIDAGYGIGMPEFDFLDSARVDITSVPNTGYGDIDYLDIGAHEYFDSDSSLENPVTPVPVSFDLFNYPNPFNSITIIKFTVIAGNWAEIKIYNILGQIVLAEDFNNLETESVSFTWDGKDIGGKSVASGIYFCRLEQLAVSRTIKMLILR